MKKRRTRLRSLCGQEGVTLLALLVIAWGCAKSETDKEGSQTHFTETGAESDSAPETDLTTDAQSDQTLGATDSNDEQSATAGGDPPSEQSTNGPGAPSGEGSTESDAAPPSMAEDVTDPESEATDDAESDVEAEVIETDETQAETDVPPEPSSSSEGTEVEPAPVTDPQPMGVERPLCSPTQFEDTSDGCVEESWAWDGEACRAVIHCGCAGGDCDRLHDDAAGCESAHAVCVPQSCRAQDAASAGPMCGSIEGFAFNGFSCQGVYCVCGGADCDVIEQTEEACLAAFSHCVDRIPACVPDLFPVVDTDPGYLPSYPPYGFDVEGVDELFDEETGSATIFPEWTDVEWLGWEAPMDAGGCVPVPQLTFSFSCPDPRALLLRVGEETVRVNVTMHWGTEADDFTPGAVQARIVSHPSGTSVFEVREAATELPVVMAVSHMPGAVAGEPSWEFAPFSFSAGEQLCQTSPRSCNWTFSAFGLQASAAGEQWSIRPLNARSVEVDGASYLIAHGYLFEQGSVGEESCAAAFAPRHNFVLLRRPL